MISQTLSTFGQFYKALINQRFTASSGYRITSGIHLVSLVPNKERPAMKRGKNIESKYADEAPTWQDFIIVILIALLLTALDWIAYFKLGWLH